MAAQPVEVPGVHVGGCNDRCTPDAHYLMPVASQPPTVGHMVEAAKGKVHLGVDPQRLVDVAIAHRDRWARLVEEQEAGAELDGRASIYTSETYAQARDRWEAYRVALLEEIRDGGC